MMTAFPVALAAQTKLYIEDPTPIYRAAYCVGVLRYEVKESADTAASEDHARFLRYACQNSEEIRRTRGATDVETCLRNSAAADAALLQEMQSKLDRYNAFINRKFFDELNDVPFGNLTSPSLDSLRNRVGWRMLQGHRDAAHPGDDMAKMVERTNNTSRCANECGVGKVGGDVYVQCLADCFAKFDQTEANIIECHIVKLPRY